MIIIFVEFIDKLIDYPINFAKLGCGASNEYPQHVFSWRNKKTSRVIYD